MGQYLPGDVLLASVALDDRTPPKTRPVVVVRVHAAGCIHICPVSSKPPSDAPCLPFTLEDFASGGLDLFSESYIMITRVLTIHNSGVIGKKGRLTAETLAEILARVPSSRATGSGEGKKPGSKKSRSIR